MSKRQRERRAKRRRHASRGRAVLGISVLTGAAFVAPAVSHAATYSVTSVLDDGSAGTLRQAITDAEAHAGADDITFTSGLTGTIQLQSPLPTITQDLTITGPGSDHVTIDGSNLSDNPILLAVKGYGNPNTPITVSVSDLAFANGTELSSGYSGGAIGAFNTHLTVTDSLFTGNTGNVAGAIGTQFGTTHIYSSDFSGNTASNTGGAVSVIASQLSLTNSTVSGNSSANGGGVYAYYSPTTFLRSTIADNTATGGGGGGGALIVYGSSQIDNSTISGNHAAGNGGGLYLYSTGYYDVYDGRFSNSTITNNSADGQGAGIFSVGGTVASSPYAPSRGQLNVRSSTIAGNRAIGSGGGIQANGNSYGYASALQNTAIGCNSTEATDGADLGRSIDQNAFDASFSLIQNAPSGSFTTTVAGSNIVGQNPQLAELADNGGKTETRGLAPNSPLIDQGSADVATDQRGQNREVDQPAVANSTASGADNSDVGAFELQNGEGPFTAAACDSHVGPQPPKPAPQTPPAPVVTPGPSDGTVGVKGIKATKNGVTFTVTCTVAACNGRGVLSVVERLNGKRITRLLKVHKRRVRVGAKSYALAAGQTKKVTIKLNGKGRKLLRRFRKLPVRLVVSQQQSTGKNQVVASKKLRIKAKKKKK